MTRRALVFLLALLPAIIFLLQDGYFASSDGMIHLYRLFELDRGLHEGILFPRWFPLSGYGYGLPALNYYPPLMYYLAELFHLLGAGYIVAIKLTIATSFALAAIGMFLFARDWLSDSAAFVAAIAYAYSPYLLSDAYVRGNFPEMLAMALLPFALWAVARVKAEGSRQYAVGSAQKTRSFGICYLSFVIRSSSFILLTLSFAAIILAHHLTAMQFATLLLVYVVFLFVLDIKDHGLGVSGQRSAVSGQRSAVGGLIARIVAIAIALALSAFYWVPALAELNLVYVESGSLARFLVSRLINPADFFAPALAYTYLPQSDALKHAFGFPQTALALLAGVVALFQILRFTPHASRLTPHASRFTAHVLFFWLLVIFSIFMTLTFAAPLWYAIPTLRFMQFPWRFQILAAIGIAFLIGVWAQWIGDALSVSLRAILSGAKRSRRIATKQSPNAKRGIASQKSLAMTMVTLAFVLALIALGIANLPVRAFPLDDAQVDLTRADDHAYVVAQMGWGWTREFVPATVQESEKIYAPIVKSNVPLPDPARPIPSVQILNDGLYTRALRVSTVQPFELSLKTFFFPGWQAYIDGALARTYPCGALGLVSVAIPPGDHAVVFRFEDTPLRVAMNVVSLAALVGWLGSLLVTRRRAFIAVIGASILIGALFAWQTRAPRAQPPTAIAATLDSRVQLIGYATERAGESLYVTLHWLALNELDRDYHSYAHLIDAAGNVVAQNDGLTDQGLTPTTRWLPGEIVSDRRVIAWRDLAPGDYRLAAGMYLPLENGFQNLGARVELGSIQIQR